MERESIESVINSAIITAFTIAAALIWKDVIVEVIEIFFPQEALFYKFAAAIASIFLVVIIILIIMKTEDEASKIIKDLRKISKTKRKKILKEIAKEAEKVEEPEKETPVI